MFYVVQTITNYLLREPHLKPQCFALTCCTFTDERKLEAFNILKPI